MIIVKITIYINSIFVWGFKNGPIGDINIDEIINILDVIILVSEILESSNKYCIYVNGDFDYNQDLDILDIIQLVSFILNN